jgi:hypothetical protein
MRRRVAFPDRLRDVQAEASLLSYVILLYHSDRLAYRDRNKLQMRSYNLLNTLHTLDKGVARMSIASATMWGSLS